QKEGVRYPAVDDVCLGYAPLDGVQACLHLGGHARGEFGEQGAQFVGVEATDEFGVVRVIGEQSLDVGEHDELSGVQGGGECGGGGVARVVVAAAVVGSGPVVPARAASGAGACGDGSRGDVSRRAGPADVRATSVDGEGLASGVDHGGVLSCHADGERAVVMDQ